MALKKTYSAKIGYKSERIEHPDGTYHYQAVPFPIVPQKDIDMHSIEESMTMAHWAHNEYLATIPSMPTKDDEHEWMIEHGPEYIKQKRTEAQAAIDSMKPKELELEKAWRDSEKEWNDHCDWCSKNGHDHDTYTGSK